MAVIVNGTELTDKDIERELAAHADMPDAQQAALTAAVLRRVLLDEAAHLNLASASNDEQLIEALLDHQLAGSVGPTQEECERHYLADQERWRMNERARVSHILFQVTERVDLAALKTRAQQTLDDLLLAGDDIEQRFTDAARTLSNCPSGADGGALGEIGRGDTVAEFERAVFAAPAGTLCPALVETEFGFHIVRVHDKSPGHVLPFEQVELRIRDAMSHALRDLAERRYVTEAVARADIVGWKDGKAI
ncbi:PpiC-type peptidyl-prolyl cis-trans isomerase [Caballeronia sordidicola]|uniref:peptidylprolyl isomerase n=1 Tax=Caballeronia sordidicola TaxID=196367 RepID=A0A158FTV2_CABSO|nr:peptidylprolyl isomerase [Caballeronia sordidicola]SAL23286.1 PpiC-type peptidyl-prolyl cis-trans isomerase [Caballeronia sordidicola]